MELEDKDLSPLKAASCLQASQLFHRLAPPAWLRWFLLAVQHDSTKTAMKEAAVLEKPRCAAAAEGTHPVPLPLDKGLLPEHLHLQESP